MSDFYYRSGEIPPIYYECISKAVFGTQIYKLEEEYGPINSTENIFDKIPYQKYLLVQSMERVVDALIGIGLGYKEIEEFLLNHKPNDIVFGLNDGSINVLPNSACSTHSEAHSPVGQTVFVSR